MAAAMAGHVAELVCGIRDKGRLSFRLRSLRAVPSETSNAAGVVNFTPFSCLSVIRSSPSAQPCRGRIKATAAALVNGGTAEGQQGLFSNDELLMLRKKAADISPHLQGTSIFLVGMSKSGKTTVGKCLSEALGYYFFDSEQLVEQAAGEQLSQMEDDEVENAETEVLMQLSPLVRLIVATGERAVLTPRNWGYLRDGVTVWLDWPIDSLVQRMADTEAAREKVLEDTRKGLQDRVDFYANADATVSVEKIAALKDIEDLNCVTPPMVAFHVLEVIHSILRKAEQSR